MKEKDILSENSLTGDNIVVIIENDNTYQLKKIIEFVLGGTT